MKRWGLALPLCTAACTFGAPGSDSKLDLADGDTTGDDGGGPDVGDGLTSAADDGSGGGDQGDTATTMPADTGNDGSDTTSAGEAGEDTDTASASTGTVPGDALLQIMQAPTVDFGPVSLSSDTAQLLDVTNAGDGPASMVGGMVDAPFAFTGSGYPGAGGSCGASIGIGESCTIEVAFSPTVLGPHDGQLALDYDDGTGMASVSVALVGAGSGATGELVIEGGAEGCGTGSLPSWVDEGPGNWFCGTPLIAYAGNYVLYSADGPNNEVYVLRQTIDLAAYANAIDTGNMQFSFAGYGRAVNDQYRIRVRFFDDTDTFLDDSDSGWLNNNTMWQAWTWSGTAPVNARVVNIDLNCQKSGGSLCEAYFDEISLSGSYP